MMFPLNLVKFTTAFSDFSGSKEALDLMKLSILDWAAVGISGRTELVSKAVFDMISDERGE